MDILTGYIAVKVVFGLIIVIALMLVLILITRYLQSKKSMLRVPRDRIAIQQQMHLGGRNRMYVVRWQGYDYLIGFGQNGGFMVDKTLSPNPKPTMTSSLKTGGEKRTNG